MFALASIKLFTQCRCRRTKRFSCPRQDFCCRCTTTGRRLMSDFLVAATPSLHRNKWSFSHMSRFLRHSTDKIVRVYVFDASGSRTVSNNKAGLLNNINNKENNSKPEKGHSDKTIYVKKCRRKKTIGK